MNADKRTRIALPLAVALVCTGLSTRARSGEPHSQLASEIERRFEATAITLDDSPLEFGCKFSTYVTSCRTVSCYPWHGRCVLLTPNNGAPRLEEAATLPQPTLVETFIAKGFPSGELSRDASVHDDSYLFAKDYRAFRGWGFNR